MERLVGVLQPVWSGLDDNDQIHPCKERRTNNIMCPFLRRTTVRIIIFLARSNYGFFLFFDFFSSSRRPVERFSSVIYKDKKRRKKCRSLYYRREEFNWENIGLLLHHSEPDSISLKDDINLHTICPKGLVEFS